MLSMLSTLSARSDLESNDVQSHCMPDRVRHDGVSVSPHLRQGEGFVIPDVRGTQIRNPAAFQLTGCRIVASPAR
jgi:hypothetical protein